jgi:oligopeptide transport system substrate-binding protein
MPAFIFALLLVLFAAPLAADEAVDFKQQRISIFLLTEPPNLNSLVSTDQISSLVLSHVMEGLLHYDQHGKLAPGVAERWELRPDGATFWLRRDARWSDGKPVTAHDFVFAWRMAVTPSIASQYAPALFPIRNAERVNRGELPQQQLGVRAVNAYQLDVQFERPCPYFPGLTASFTFYPVREDFYRARGERYAADAGDLLYNGAFTISRWVHGARLTLERNSSYWDRDNIHLQTIDVPYFTSDANAIFNLYKNGSIALAQLEPETLRESIERGYTVKQFSTGSMYYWEFNMRPGRVAANRSFRLALQALFDPELLVNKIVGLPGVRAADSLFPRAFKMAGSAFLDQYPPPLPRRNLALARQRLEQARRELNIVHFPPLLLLSGDSPRAQKESEYFQQLLSAGLGLDVRIDRQTFKQRLDKMTRGEFDIVAAAWGPDYDDLLTFGDLMASWNENNRGRYHNAEYDRLVQLAQREPDAQKRFAAFAAMQRLLIDDAPLLMSYENAISYVQHPQLQGVNRSIFGGDPNYRYARVIEPIAGPVAEPTAEPKVAR